MIFVMLLHTIQERSRRQLHLVECSDYKQKPLQQTWQPDEEGFKLCGLGYEKATL